MRSSAWAARPRCDRTAESLPIYSWQQEITGVPAEAASTAGPVQAASTSGEQVRPGQSDSAASHASRAFAAQHEPSETVSVSLPDSRGASPENATYTPAPVTSNAAAKPARIFIAMRHPPYEDEVPDTVRERRRRVAPWQTV